MNDLVEPASNQAVDPIKATQHWLDTMVVGLNLCPFAAPVVNTQALKIINSPATELKQIITEVLTQLDLIQQADESEISTSLLIFSAALNDFDDYWSAVDLAEELLHEAGLAEIIQIASFHPDYCFDGVEPDDVSNYTNRSPYPMMHFIREAQLTRALQNYPDPENIPARNIERLKQLGIAEILKRLDMS
jgi:hypothetical protein